MIAMPSASRHPAKPTAARVMSLARGGQTLLTPEARDALGETALKLVSDTIRGWDAKTITDRLENAVGDDLQYIRINGTLVGGLVGVLIHTVDVLL